jgi:hypothetical protein
MTLRSRPVCSVSEAAPEVVRVWHRANLEPTEGVEGSVATQINCQMHRSKNAHSTITEFQCSRARQQLRKWNCHNVRVGKKAIVQFDFQGSLWVNELEDVGEI